MQITIPCFGIVIEIIDNGGKITSDLKHANDKRTVQAAMDAIESLILAHAVAGVDVASPAYVEGIEIAVEACWNNLG
jgi:hypothetical protein